MALLQDKFTGDDLSFSPSAGCARTEGWSMGKQPRRIVEVDNGCACFSLCAWFLLLSTALSLKTENTALKQILSWFILFFLLPSHRAISTPNTIHHSRLTACLPDSLDFVDFVLVKHLWISWFPRLSFCGRSRNLEFMITIRIIIN